MFIICWHSVTFYLGGARSGRKERKRRKGKGRGDRGREGERSKCCSTGGPRLPDEGDQSQENEGQKGPSRSNGLLKACVGRGVRDGRGGGGVRGGVGGKERGSRGGGGREDAEDVPFPTTAQPVAHRMVPPQCLQR
jgi:hypothetical protein